MLGIKPGIEPKLALVVVFATHAMAPAARGALTNAARLIKAGCLVIGDLSALPLAMATFGRPTGQCSAGMGG